MLTNDEPTKAEAARLEFARRLRAAMDYRRNRIRQSDVADHCGVTPQAVYKWRTMGACDLMVHLHKLAEATEVPTEFYIEQRPGSSPETASVWKKLTTWMARAAVFVLVAIPPLLFPHRSEAIEHNVLSYRQCSQNAVSKYTLCAINNLKVAFLWVMSHFFAKLDYGIA